jgi:hypothetical protein
MKFYEKSRKILNYFVVIAGRGIILQQEGILSNKGEKHHANQSIIGWSSGNQIPPRLPLRKGGSSPS